MYGERVYASASFTVFQFLELTIIIVILYFKDITSIKCFPYYQCKTMFLAYVFKIKPNKRQSELMLDWLDMLRATYNYCLRDRIEAYEEVRQPRLGKYSNLITQAAVCPLTCSVSKSTNLGYPWKMSLPTLPSQSTNN